MNKKEILHLAKWAGYIALGFVVLNYVFGSKVGNFRTPTSPLNVVTGRNLV